jgi:LmbE family N-acetylglucosaminyl deacetylase
VLTHGSDGEYGHPQHRFTHVASRAALQSLAPWRPEQFITWMARSKGNSEDRLANQGDPATLTIDIGPWLEQKVAAAMCHRSQHAMFLRNSKQRSVREMVRREEHLRVWGADEYLEAVSWDSRAATTPPSDW